MITKKYIYIANWKMYFSFNELKSLMQENADDLIALAQNHSLIVCPSFEALFIMQSFFCSTAVAIGAQNCSEHALGAFTGQISVQSLQELGVTHCIIGHSEVRKMDAETNNTLFNKLNRLISHAITPIFCVGETKEQYEDQKTYDAIQQQLEPVLRITEIDSKNPIYIAYEPIWAIGAGSAASNDHIHNVLTYIRTALSDNTIGNDLKNRFMYLYGGTVTSQTSKDLKQIGGLDGFLIGKASTNFQELKKIVS